MKRKASAFFFFCTIQTNDKRFRQQPKIKHKEKTTTNQLQRFGTNLTEINICTQ